MDPAQIGRYRVVAVLGRGGMTRVYRCEDPESGQEVAIKVFYADADLSRVKTLTTLNHPHLARIYDFLTFENLLAIVMELLKGSFLREILPARPKLPMERNLAILSQIAEGLDYAHERGIIHGDLTPANILIQEGDWARLTDFRVVYITPAPLGNPMYLAPEELRGEPLTKAADQYHLALIAHAMLTGRLPWTDEGTNKLIFRKLAGEYHPGAEDAQRLGSARIAALRRALDREPPKRFTSCGEFIRALE